MSDHEGPPSPPPPPPGGGWQPPQPPPPPGGWQPPQPPPQQPGWGQYQGQPGQYPPGWQQSPYGYGYPYAQPPRTEGTAIAALILAIASFVVCPLVPAVIALVLASQAKQKIDVSGGAVTGEGLVTGARIIALINIGLVALGIVAVAAIALLGSTAEDEFNKVGDELGLALPYLRAALGR